MKSLKKIAVFLILLILGVSCTQELVPKPKAFLRLTYNNENYKKIENDCPYSFELSNIASANFTNQCWTDISYPSLKASLKITYRPVENNLNELLQESEKLTYNHAVKADGISQLPYLDVEKQKFGALSEVTGNAASPLQFYVTDSTRHFITGALYFKVQPNYDSILPAIKFVEKDIKHLMETLEWNN